MSFDLDPDTGPRARPASPRRPGGPTPAAALAAAVADWALAERRYRDASWAGLAARIVARRYGSRPVLITAPHAGHQLRNGWAKPADGGTGGLAETVARVTGCAVVAACGVQSDDPNWDVETRAFKAEAMRRLERHPFSIDVHGMNSSRHVDICIGVGSQPDVTTLGFAQQMAALARHQGFLVTVNHPFPAAGPGTMTTFVQKSGYRGIQVEINWRFLDAEGDPQSAARVLEWLRDVVTMAPAGRP